MHILGEKNEQDKSPNKRVSTLLAIKTATPGMKEVANFKITWKKEEVETCKWLVFQRI